MGDESAWAEWSRKIRTGFSKAKPISTSHLAEMLSDSTQRVVLLDVRQPDEYHISRLHPHAQRIDHPASFNQVKQVVEQTVPDFQPENDVVVCYCSIGYRSGKAAEVIQDEGGWSHVYNLDGGLFRWANESRPLVQGEDAQPARGVHPYNDVFGKMLESHLHQYPEDHTKSRCIVS